MSEFWKQLKRNWWPVSAILFCPCHLPLTLGAVASLTAGTALGTIIAAHYNTIETVLAVTFSFYFVLAFMMWVVRGPRKQPGAACAIDDQGKLRLPGLSTRQIITWGLIGMFTPPALVSVSFFTEQKYMDNDTVRMVLANTEVNSGLIWLISLAVVVMIPVMVIWLVWLWLAWSQTDFTDPRLENWQYEFEQ